MFDQIRWRDIRPELGPTARLALPLIVAQLSFMGMGTVDTIMAGRLGATELAAVAVGSNTWFLGMILFTGMIMSVSPILAQHIGGGLAPAGVGRLLRGMLVVGLCAGLLWTLAVLLSARPILGLLKLPAEHFRLSLDYLHIVAFAGIPYALAAVLRNACEAHAVTRLSLTAGLAGLGFNAMADWGLMYGHWGLPALGVRGVAIATLLAGVVMAAVYASGFWWVRRLRSVELFRHRNFDFRAAATEMLRLGLPIAAILTAESWLFSVCALLMARFGPDAVAAHQIAINFASMTFMVPMSIGFATTVRVGHAAGAGKRVEAAVRGYAGIVLGAGFAMVSALAMLLFPSAIASIYTQSAAVAARATGFLGLAAVFQLFDGIQATAGGALRGLKDTRLPMFVTVGAYWLVGFPFAAMMAFATGAGPSGIWYGFILGLGVAAAGLAARLIAVSHKALAVAAPSTAVSDIG